MNNAKLKFAVSTVVSVIAALAIFLVVLMIAQKNHHTFDLTKDKRFTLSPQSVQVIKELPQNVQALAFLLTIDTEGRQRAEDLLTQYRQADASKFSYKIVDPKRDPLLAKKYEVRMPGCVIFVAGNKHTSRSSAVDETQMTNALLKLSDIAEKKVYFLQGHGEAGAYSANSEQNMQGMLNMSQFRADMTVEGFAARDLNLSETKKIPDDAAVLVIAGPKTELLPAEEKLIEEWIAKGGRLWLALEMETRNKYDAFLNKYGFLCPDEIVIDPMAELAGAQAVYSMALQYNQQSPIVKDFNMTTLYALARPIEPADKLPEGVSVMPLMLTGPNSFTLKLSAALENSGRELSEKDAVRKNCSLPLACVGTYPVPDTAKPQEAKENKEDDGKNAGGKDGEDPKKTKEGRIVVFGDSEFFCNVLYKSVGNRDLALNVLNWLGESENHITIRSKEESCQPLVLAENTALRIKVFLVFALPLCVLIVGIFNARSRRRRS